MIARPLYPVGTTVYVAYEDHILQAIIKYVYCKADGTAEYHLDGFMGGFQANHLCLCWEDAYKRFLAQRAVEERMV